MERLVDLTGEKFGKLTIIELAGHNKYNEYAWRCRCNCGNEMLVSSRDLRSGRVKSCGCSRIKDLRGKKFGKLAVIERTKPDEHNHTFWRCKCDCGNERLVASGYQLQIGNIKDCGCVLKKKQVEAAFNRIYLRYKANARHRELEFSLTKDKFRELITSNCCYCGAEPSQIEHSVTANEDFIYNGIDRVDNSKGYFKDNVKTCCRQCNFIKGTHSIEEFLSMVKTIYEHLNSESM